MYWITTVILNLHVSLIVSTVVDDVTFVVTTEGIGHSVIPLLSANTKLVSE